MLLATKLRNEIRKITPELEFHLKNVSVNEEAERLTQRFVRVFAPNVTCKQVQIQGWSQSDWWNVFVWCNNGDVDAYAKELEQYFVGTVWVVESGDECICGLYADSMEEAIELFNENRG